MKKKSSKARGTSRDRRISRDWAEDVVGRILLPPAKIARRVRELGKEITRDYSRSPMSGKDLVAVAVLRGASLFFADVIREIRVPLIVDFISASSYGKETKTTGEVKIVKDLQEPIRGKNVLLVEDVVDSGLTLAFLQRTLRARGARSVRICALLDKPHSRRVKIRADYVGFTLPNLFVIGYGLDYEERYRNLPYVAVPREDR